MLITIKKGLDLPINGKPEQLVHNSQAVNTVALLGDDYPGIKPKIHVNPDDRVKLGQVLFTDKLTRVNYTSPACGVVSRINRGAKRVLQSIEIKIAGDDEESFDSYSRESLSRLTAADVKENLLASGLWSAIRARPYSKNPLPESRPDGIFVTAIDTEPLAPDPAVIVREYEDAFRDGVTILSRLADAPVFVCIAPSFDITVQETDQIRVVRFAGPHPAGLPGTHIHFLHTVSAGGTAWHVNYQDVIAIGKLFTSGRLWVERVIALGGPRVQRPRLLRTRLGADVNAMTRDELKPGDNRIISGSVLSGRKADSWAAYLGRYHHQISVIEERADRELFAWSGAGRDLFSINKVFMSHFFPGRHFDFTTSQNGSRRALVPIGNFERVMPLNILPVPLLRALLVRDTEMAQSLGCLELDEEDLALCTFVCCSKLDYGAALRASLDKIEAES